MHFRIFLSVSLLSLRGSSVVNGHIMRGRDSVSTAPNCSSTCLTTYIPQFCGSTSNLTCSCTNTDLTAAVTKCASQLCGVTDLLRLERYAAVSCGVPNDKSHLDVVLHVIYVIPFLTACFLGGRLLGRFLLRIELGADDWVMVASFISYLAGVGTSLGMVLNGFGEHVFWLSKEQIITALKYFYAAELFYILSNTLTKLSLLLFFLRIFPNQSFRLQVQVVSLFVILTGLALFISLTFQCVPVSGYWTNWYLPAAERGKCIEQYAALYVGSALSIFQNIIILVLPISTLWGLGLSTRRRINALLMFSVGSGVVVFSFLRLPSLAHLKGSGDFSFDQAPIIVYSHLEQAFGIICACLPACRSLLEYFFPALKLRHGDEPASNSRYLHVHTTAASGSKSPLERCRRHTSSRSLVELRDVESRVDVDRHRSKDSRIYEGGPEYMSSANVAIGTAVSMDDNGYGVRGEEKGAVDVSVQDETRRASETNGGIFMQMTVEQTNESVEEARLRHERAHGGGKG